MDRSSSAAFGQASPKPEDFAPQPPHPGGDPSHLGCGSERRGLVKPVMEMQTAVARLCQWKRTICIQAPSNSAGHGQQMHRVTPTAVILSLFSIFMPTANIFSGSNGTSWIKVKVLKQFVG